MSLRMFRAFRVLSFAILGYCIFCASLASAGYTPWVVTLSISGLGGLFAAIALLYILFEKVFTTFVYGSTWDQAAKTLGLVYRPATNYRDHLQLPPVLVTGSSGYSLGSEYWDESTGLTLCQVAITNGNDRASFSTNYIVASIYIASPLPHIFVDGLRRNSFRKSSELWALNKRLILSTKMIDLEGDFYKFFNVYTTNKGELDALTIMTPDVMLEMRERGYDFDYEIFGNRLYIIRDGHIKSVDDIVTFVQTARRCSAEFYQQLGNHNFSNTFEQLPLNPARTYRWGIIYSLREIGLALLFCGICAAIGFALGLLLK